MPILRKDIVPRTRLIERLNAGLWQEDGFVRKLTLVSAAAGYGKTTLVTEWLQNIPLKSTWLSLDESDNDRRRFLAYLLTALRQIDAGIGKYTEAVLQSPQSPPGDVILTALVNEIAAVCTAFSNKKLGSLGFAVRGPIFWGVWAAKPPTHPKIWVLTTVIPIDPKVR